MQGLAGRRQGPYLIRHCQPRDLHGVVNVNLVALPEHYTDGFYEELLHESPETFLISEMAEQIVGYIMCRMEYGFTKLRKFGLARRGHIVSVAVLTEHRRRGVGRALVEEALLGMKARGCSEAYLEVRVSNTPAIDLYKALGFEVNAVQSQYYRDGEDAYVMSLGL